MKKMRIFSVVSAIVLVIAIVTCSVLGHKNTSGLAQAAFKDSTKLDGNGNAQGSGGTGGATANSVEYISIDTPDRDYREVGQYDAVLNDKVVCFNDEETKKIYSAIQSIETKATGVYVEVSKDAQSICSLGKGDIFVLEDFGDSPFGETYIGKIVDKVDNGNKVTYTFDNPTFDEVFDKLDLDVSTAFDNSDIGDIVLMDGVSVEYTDDISSHINLTDGNTTRRDRASLFNNIYPGVQVASIGAVKLPGSIALAAAGPEITGTTKKGTGLVYEYEIDILEALGIKEGDKDDDQQITSQEAYGIKVYRIDTKFVSTGKEYTGKYYHTESCSMITTMQSYPNIQRVKVESTVGDERDHGRTPCTICKPQFVDSDEKNDGSAEWESSLTIQGSAGIENIYFKGNLDYDVKSDCLLKDLYFELGGKIVTDTNLVFNGEYSLGGNTTGITLPNGLGKVEGLDEKLFPIACVQFNGTLTPLVLGGSNVALRKLNSNVPISVNALFYVDIKGNLTISASVGFKYEQEFIYKNTVVRDGKWVSEDKLQTNVTKSLNLELTAEFDYDAHVGLSVGFYIFNLNVAEIAVVKVGFEGEGKGSISYSLEFEGPVSDSISKNSDDDPTNDVEETTTPMPTGKFETEFEIYNRMYIKLLELNIRLSVQINFFDIINFSPSIEETACFKDWTVFEWGNKEEMVFELGDGKYSAAVAKDDDAVYYMDSNKSLTKETNNGEKTVLMENVSYICGMDEKYVYVIARNEVTNQDCMYRVNKVQGGGRQIEEDIRYVLEMDDEYIYYTTNFDPSMLKRIKRADLSTSYFANFEDDVEYAKFHGEDMLVAIDRPNNLWGVLREYYIIDDEGEIQESLGLINKEEMGWDVQMKSYTYKVLPITSHMLVSSVGAVSIEVKNEEDKLEKKFIECNGYLFTDNSIYIVRKPEPLSDDPIMLLRVNTYTGEEIPLMELNNADTLFTLYPTNDNGWYYLDQIGDEIQLCKTDAAFSTKTVIDTIDAKKYGVSLSGCKSKRVGDTLYFYNINGTQVISIYRYDLE